MGTIGRSIVGRCKLDKQMTSSSRRPKGAVTSMVAAWVGQQEGSTVAAHGKVAVHGKAPTSGQHKGGGNSQAVQWVPDT